MESLARNNPYFVLPVPHESQGAEMHFMQWTFDAASKTSTVLFTQLAEYKARGEFAQPHTTVTHHLDLIKDKELVLMQGHVMEGRNVQPDHAKWLVMCLQRFYGGWEQKGDGLDGQRKERAEERQKLLEWFTNGDPGFSIEKLLEEAERMG
jgi:ATP synthase F1 complex assembly factor 1